MPSARRVYLPTTESYRPQWSGRQEFLSETTGCNRAKWRQRVVLIFSILAIAGGLIMILEGSLDISGSKQVDDNNPHLKENAETDTVLIVMGCFILLIGFILIGIYICCRRKCFWCCMQREVSVHYVRTPEILLDCKMDPATSLLIIAPYAPDQLIPYQPPPVSGEEETRKLMGNDNKDCTEDNERILDKDPRIVLRPLSKVEESRDAEAF